MAWRDMRSAKRKLLLFALAVVSGIAALVAINSFRANLRVEMDRQSRSLLGADVEFDSRNPFTEDAEALMESLPTVETAREVHFATMAYFPTQDDTRIVRARGMSGGFPWYGEMETRPAGLSVSGASEALALVEDTIMLQFDLQVGDPIKIGDVEFTIIGELLKIPGDGSFSGTFAPRVLFPLEYLEKTGLAQFGSRLRYFLYHKYDDGTLEAANLALESLRESIESEDVDVDSVEDQRRQIGQTLENMTSFLSMIGFVALLLGGIAIAGAVQVYLKGKVDAVATLRCLGAKARQATLIYCIQISLVGLVGSVAGAALGVAIQQSIAGLMDSFLPFSIPLELSWSSILGSLAFGWAFTSLFALLPLLPLRKVSPLRAIRVSIEENVKSWKDGPFLLALFLIIVLAGGFTWLQTSNWIQAASFFGGILLAIALLSGIGSFLRALLRRFSFDRLPFVWRQGLANLYRPNNRTILLVVTLGMGAFLIYTIYISERSMLQQGDFVGREGQPNVILFDIQPDQLEGVEQIARDLGMETRDTAPIVTMRLSSLNGRTASELAEDKSLGIESWSVWREYRSTYRNYLNSHEELIEGEFTAEASLDSGQPIPVSVEARIVEALKLTIGDVIEWDVQGFPIRTKVDSIRKVDWREMKPNFFVVFPKGVLEAAPAFFITSTRAPDSERLVALQSAIVKTYPNVSAVNLTMILETLSEIFDKISFVIRFMASFTIITGLAALMASVLTSRYQRNKESALLRTLGSQGRQIRGIMAVEYALVGVLAGASGVLLSLAAGWAITRFVLRVDLFIPWDVTIGTAFIVGLLTLGTGMLNSVGISRRSPMESIRSEAP